MKSGLKVAMKSKRLSFFSKYLALVENPPMQGCFDFMKLLISLFYFFSQMGDLK